MRKLNHFLNALIGGSVGVFLGHGISAYGSFRNHPEWYEVQSAPWYTSVIVYGLVTAAIVAAAIVGKLLIRRSAAKGQQP